MLNKRLIGTFAPFVAAGVMALSSYSPSARADETNSVPLRPTIGYSVATNLAGVKVFRLNVKDAIPNSTNNFVDTRGRFPNDENLDGNWKLFKKNITADSLGRYQVDVPYTEGSKYVRAGYSNSPAGAQ